MKLRRIAAFATAIAASMAIVACGSSNSSTTSSGGSSATSTSGSSGSSGSVAKGTINGAGSTLAAPIYQQWGSTLKGQGLTVNFNPVGSGAGLDLARVGDG